MANEAQNLKSEWPTLACVDARADGGQREVTLLRQGIVIRRRHDGVRMKIRVPARAYRGVVFKATDEAADKQRYVVSLSHVDADLRILLADTSDEREAFAHLQYWGEYFALPLYVERADGQMDCIRRRLGNVDCATPQDHARKGTTLMARRGRFQRRRKPGSPARMNLVHRGAREIIARH